MQRQFVDQEQPVAAAAPDPAAEIAGREVGGDPVGRYQTNRIASNAMPGSIWGRIRNRSVLAVGPGGASGSTGIVIASP
jgi:hypothetical protein